MQGSINSISNDIKCLFTQGQSWDLKHWNSTGIGGKCSDCEILTLSNQCQLQTPAASTLACLQGPYHVPFLLYIFTSDIPPFGLIFFLLLFIWCATTKGNKKQREKLSETLRDMLVKLCSEQKYISLDTEHCFLFITLLINYTQFGLKKKNKSKQA